jgi:hypothetical protein
LIEVPRAPVELSFDRIVFLGSGVAIIRSDDPEQGLSKYPPAGHTALIAAKTI